MVSCHHCGGEDHGGARFCTRCGQQLERSWMRSAETKMESISPRIRTRIPRVVTTQLHPAEQVLATFSAALGEHQRPRPWRHDTVVLTTERLIHVRSGFVHQAMGALPYTLMTGVAYSRGGRHSTVVIAAAPADLTLSRMGHEDAAFTEKVIAGSIAGWRYQVA